MTRYDLITTATTFTLPLRGGLGDNVDIAGQEGPTTGQLLDMRVGTAAAPDSNLNPVVKISRTVSYTAPWQSTGSQRGAWFGVADVNAVGLVAQVSSPASNQAQVIGVHGIAKTFANTYGLNHIGLFSSADAVGIQGTAWAQGIPRIDANCTTVLNNAVVGDASIVAADVGKLVSGTNMPVANTYVGTVTPGVNFRLSSSSTSQVDVLATGTGTVSLSIGGCISAAIGLVMSAHGVTSTAKAVNAFQSLTYNDTGFDSSVNPAGQTFATGYKLYSYGAYLGGVGIEFIGPDGVNGSQFDVCIHFSGQTALTRNDTTCTLQSNTVVLDPNVLASDYNSTVTANGGGIPTNVVITSVTPGVSFTISKAATRSASGVTCNISKQGPSFTAAIQDDSDSLYGLYMTANCNHQLAAIAIGAGAGSVLIGEATITNAAALLEVVNGGKVYMSVGAGGFITKSGNYTMLPTDDGTQVTATCTITLPPTANAVQGKPYYVKNFAAGITVTISTGGANVIDSGGGLNATSETITTQGQTNAYVVAANGTDWVKV